MAEKLSEFVSGFGRPEDQLLVTAEIKRLAARITEGDIQLIANLSLTEQVFLEKLEVQDRSPKETIGLLLFSAIRFESCLLNTQFNVEQFFHKLSNGELPHVINGTTWYDLNMISRETFYGCQILLHLDCSINGGALKKLRL